MVVVVTCIDFYSNTDDIDQNKLDIVYFDMIKINATSDMSVDSEDRLLTSELHDETIITIPGSSEDAIDASGTGESGGVETNSQDMETDSAPSAEPFKCLAEENNTKSFETEEGTGDLNTEDLSDFERGMQNLDMTGGTGGPMNDSGRVEGSDQMSSSLTQTDEIDANLEMAQLFETCSMIETRQNSKFPAKPPTSCLMDAQTVSK